MNLRSLSGSVGWSLNPGLVETVDVEKERLLEQGGFVSGLVELAQVIKYPGGLPPKNWTIEKCSSAQVKGAERNEEEI